MDKTLFKTALFLSLLGIFLLIIISNFIEPRLSKIESIDRKNIEDFIKIKGNISDIKNIGNMTLFRIGDETGKINGIIYDNEKIKERKNVIIIGKIMDFEGELEIEVRSIRENY